MAIESSTQNSVCRRRCAAGIIAIAVLAAYANSFSGPFVFDDGTSIAANPTIRHLWPLWLSWFPPHGGGLTVSGRPVLNFSLALNFAISGNAVWSYHAVNIAVHILSALTLFGIIRRTLELPRCRERFGLENDWATAFAAVVTLTWALHPLQTEAVTYIIQRAESLMGLFFLFLFYCFLRGSTGLAHKGWLLLGILVAVAGMGTKEVMATAPLLLLIYDRTFVSGSFRAAFLNRRWFYLALVGTWLPLAYLFAKSGGNRDGSIGFGIGVGFWEHALTQLPALVHYLRLTCWPDPLAIDYEPIWIHDANAVFLPAVVVLTLLIGTFWGLWRGSPLGFLGAWFFAVLAPTSLMPAPSQLISEHRMYLPLAAMITLTVWGLYRLLGKAGLGIACGIAAILGIATFERNSDYRTAINLWSDTTAKRPNNALAHEMYAQALDEAGRRNEGLIEHKTAVRIRPDLAVAQDQLGDDLLWTGHISEATEHYTAALRLKPDSIDARNGLGRALAANKRYPEAIEQFQDALAIDPNFEEAHYNLGNALSDAGRDSEAILEYEKALQKEPESFEVHYNLGNSLSKTDHNAEAIAQYQAASKIRPSSSRVHYNIGNSFLALKRTDEAIVEFKKAVLLDPKFADAHYNLASALVQEKRLDEAAIHFEEALRLRPDFDDARAALVWIRSQMSIPFPSDRLEKPSR